MDIMGPPGSGKGTQAPSIQQRFNVAQLAAGDMLRAAVAAKTSYGIEAKNFMDAGSLVPDDIVVGLIAENLHSDPLYDNG
jgi:adenylate kinase